MNHLELPTIKPKTEFLIKGNSIFQANTEYNYLGEVADILMQEADLTPFSVVKDIIDFSVFHPLVGSKSFLFEEGNGKCALGVNLLGWNFKDIITVSTEEEVYFQANPYSKHDPIPATPLNKTLPWYFDNSGEYSAWLVIRFSTNITNNKLGVTNDIRFISLFTYLHLTSVTTDNSFYRYPMYNTWQDGKFCTGDNFGSVYPSIFKLFQDVIKVMQDGSWNLDLASDGHKFFHWDENFNTKNNSWSSLQDFCTKGSLSSSLSPILKSELHV